MAVKVTKMIISITIIACLAVQASTAGKELNELKNSDEVEPDLPVELTEAIGNSTSCEQFLFNTTFNHRDVIGIDWKIWYFWNHRFQNNYVIRFSIPSTEVVNSFKVALESTIKPPVKWNKAILYLESSIDFNALFIETDVAGLFRMVQTPKEPASIIKSESLFALKVVEPGYILSFMNCKYRLCYALAPVGKMPEYKKCDEEAKKIGFHGFYGKCFVEPTFKFPLEERTDIHNAEKQIILEILNEVGANLGCNCN